MSRQKTDAPRRVQASGYSRFGSMGGGMKRGQNGLFRLGDAWAMEHGPPWERIGQGCFFAARLDCGRRKGRTPTLEEYDNAQNAWTAAWHANRLWLGAVQGRKWRRR